MKKYINKKTIITFIILVIMLLPISVGCGAPGKSCALPPNENNEVNIYNEVEPLFVVIIETLLDTDIKIYYYSYMAKYTLNN